MTERKIQIAFIIPGGIGTGQNNIGVPVLEQLVKLLSKEFDITVFSLFKINDDYAPRGFELVEVSAPHLLIKTIKFFSIFKNHHREKKFQVVHGFWASPSGFLATLCGKIFTIKSIVSVLGGDAIALPQINYGQLQKWLPRKLVLWTLAQADEVICLTEYLFNNLKNAGLQRKDVRIIPWGIDTSLFAFHEKPIRQPVRFLHIANLSPVKDQTTLLRAFKIINDQVPSVLTIIGEGVLEQSIKALAYELDLQDKIVFKGLMPYKELPAQYQQADVLLHTSLSEGQCEVVTEAMSSGVVVCGTGVGLLFDLPSCCVSVPVGDYQELAHQVIQLLNEPTRIIEIRNNARNWTNGHSIDWTVETISELYFYHSKS
jgi:glycosyltransferase involved in cell wall biosynthesis